MQNTTLQQIHTAFRIYPTHAQQLTCRGILPTRPKGIATPEYVLALADYVRSKRGSLTPDGDRLVKLASEGAAHE